MIGDHSELTETEKLARLRLVRSKGVGPVSFNKLLETYGSATTASQALLDQKKTLISLDTVEKEYKKTINYGADFIFLGEDKYPSSLAAIPDAPPVLTVKGIKPDAASLALGVVGARHASASGLKVTYQICQELAEDGVIIVSGLARGIDTAAHKATLPNHTIACLAGGIDFVYPPENQKLYEAIAEHGLLVSEVPFGTKPLARHFPRRNRIISGLSVGVLVVEATMRSGSLITANYAADHGREVFAIPGSPLDSRSDGTNKLIRDGAILTRSASDILNEVNSLDEIQKTNMPLDLRIPKPKPKPTQQVAIEDTNSASLMTLLGPDPVHIDDLVRLSGQSAEDVFSYLLPLEIQGSVLRHSGNRFSRNSVKIE